MRYGGVEGTALAGCSRGGAGGCVPAVPPEPGGSPYALGGEVEGCLQVCRALKMAYAWVSGKQRRGAGLEERSNFSVLFLFACCRPCYPCALETLVIVLVVLVG